jgi:hypothetical protein
MTWFSPSYKIRDGIFAESLQESRVGGTKGRLHFREIVSPYAPNSAWKLEHDNIGINYHEFSFSVGQDMLILMEFMDNKYVISTAWCRS